MRTKIMDIFALNSAIASLILFSVYLEMYTFGYNNNCNIVTPFHSSLLRTVKAASTDDYAEACKKLVFSSYH